VSIIKNIIDISRNNNLVIPLYRNSDNLNNSQTLAPQHKSLRSSTSSRGMTTTATTTTTTTALSVDPSLTAAFQSDSASCRISLRGTALYHGAHPKTGARARAEERRGEQWCYDDTALRAPAAGKVIGSRDTETVRDSRNKRLELQQLAAAKKQLKTPEQRAAKISINQQRDENYQKNVKPRRAAKKAAGLEKRDSLLKRSVYARFYQPCWWTSKHLLAFATAQLESHGQQSRALL
jgi:hypothetical protein